MNKCSIIVCAIAAKLSQKMVSFYGSSHLILADDKAVPDFDCRSG
jgi:hypothetical protein